jgi:hypothetical protein
MSAVDIAKAAGVTDTYVRKLLEQRKSSMSIEQFDSDSRDKVVYAVARKFTYNRGAVQPAAPVTKIMRSSITMDSCAL